MVPPSGETLPTPQPGTQRVLVVDDNPLNCDLLSRRLRRMGLTRVDCVHYLLALGDVSGKGAEAALCMARTVSLLRATTRQHWRAGQDPAQAVAAILAETNEALAEANDSAQFVTLFLGIADLHADRLSYACAGHPARTCARPVRSSVSEAYVLWSAGPKLRIRRRGSHDASPSNVSVRSRHAPARRPRSMPARSPPAGRWLAASRRSPSWSPWRDRPCCAGPRSGIR